MAVSSLVAAAGGGIKLVQRGQATSAGNTTITAIDTTKAFVRSFSEGAAGTVATNSTMWGVANNAGKIAQGATDNGNNGTDGSWGGSTVWSKALGSGTMDATTKQMGAYIVNSTTITVTGACRWEVVEFA
jgi:hypothetical protein